MFSDKLLETLDDLHYSFEREEWERPSSYLFEKVINVCEELATRVLKLEKESLIITKDGLIVCKGCLNGKHGVTERSIPFCETLGCQCCCAG